MKLRIVVIPAVMLALVAFGLFSGACGGGGGRTVSIDEYIQSLLAVDQAHEGRAQPLRNQLDASVGTLATDATLSPEALTGLKALLDEETRFVGEVSDIEPHSEAKTIHQEAVDALTAERDALQQVIDQADETTTIAELTSLFESDSIAQAEQRRTNACLAIQQFAKDNGTEADLTC